MTGNRRKSVHPLDLDTRPATTPKHHASRVATARDKAGWIALHWGERMRGLSTLILATLAFSMVTGWCVLRLKRLKAQEVMGFELRRLQIAVDAADVHLRRLSIEEQRLSSPQRLEEIAKSLGLEMRVEGGLHE